MAKPVSSARYRFRKIMGRTMFLLGLVCLGFFYQVPFFLTAFVCPAFALVLGVTAAGRLRWWANSPDAAQTMEWTARALLYVAVPNTVMIVLLFLDGAIKGSDSVLHDLAAWLWIAALLVPQLLWSARLRANRWAALGIALATLTASAEFWHELRKW